MVSTATLLVAVLMLIFLVPVVLATVAMTWWLVRRFDLGPALSILAHKYGISRGAIVVVGLLGVGIIALVLRTGPVAVTSESVSRSLSSH